MKIIEEKISWKPNSKWDKNNPDKIIIHHALSRKCTIHDINKWHLDNGWNGFGYHYFIDKKGNIYKGRLHSWNGCHTVGQNEQSLGICLEGCYTNYIPHGSKIDMVEKIVPEEQLNSTIDLLIYLGLPYYYHRNFTNEKDCPGKYFLNQYELQCLVDKKNGADKKQVEQWKLDEVKKAVQFGYIDNDFWAKKINDSVPVWAVLEMLNDVYEKFNTDNEKLLNRIKVLEKLVKQ